MQLQLSGFSKNKALDDNEELAPLVPITGDGNGLTPLTTIPPNESRLMDFRVKQWTMNGAAAPVSNSNGSLSASGTSATYTAPNKRPDTNPVAVTVQLEGNNKEGAKAAYMVTSSISVVESDYYLSLKIDNSSYEYIEFNTSSDPTTSAISCMVSEGTLILIGNTFTVDAEFLTRFSLTFTNVGVTSRLLAGKNKNGNDQIVFQPSLAGIYNMDYIQHTLQSANNCNVEYLSGDVITNITKYSLPDMVCEGNFSGEIFDDSFENGNTCKSSEVHKISGEFKLKIQYNTGK